MFTLLRILTFCLLALLFSINGQAQKKHDLHFGCHMTGAPIILPSLTEYERATCGSNERSDTIDVLNYAIDLDLTKFGSSIAAACTVRFTAKEDSIGALPLDLMNLNVDSVTMLGNHLTFDYDNLLLNVHLPAPITTSDTAEVTVYYHGLPTPDLLPTGSPGWGGFKYSNNIGYNLGIGLNSNPYNIGRSWHPCFDNFVERATYDISVTTSGGRTGYAVGDFLGEEAIGGDTIRRTYRLGLPNPTYLTGVAAANYIEINDMHSGVYGDYPVLLVGRTNDGPNMQSAFEYLGDAIDALEHWFGPYAWGQVGYIMTPQGAMEHSTLIAFPYGSIGGGPVYGMNRLMAHELAHHWWGNITTLSCPENMWIKEGNAEYGSHLFQEFTFGKDFFIEVVKDNHFDVLNNAHKDDGGIYHPLSGIPYEYTYGTHTYNKGAAAMHNLRGYLGDSLFSVAMTAVLDTYRFSAIDAQQMQEKLTEASGIDMSHFFNGWIYQPGFATYELDSVRYEPNGTGFDATVFVQQKLRKANSFHTMAPMEITFFDENWNTHTVRFMTNGEFSEATVQVPFAPVYQVLNDRNLLNLARMQDRKVVRAIGSTGLEQDWVALSSTSATSIAEGDSALVNVIHHWAGADPDPNQPDLRVSSTHYWTVGGDWPGSFQMKTTLKYNGTGSEEFDYDLTGTTSDSLILVWRPSAHEPWGEYPYYTKVQSPISGFGSMRVEPMVQGDYAFANGTAPLATAVADVENDFVVKYYPNPTADQLNVQAILPSPLSVQVSILDGLGQRLISQKNKALGGQLSATLSVDQLPAGMYWLEIISEDDQFRKMEKFVKE